MKKYDDIISLPHHESTTHPKMPALDRAAQFLPFAALSGHNTSIRETARLTESRAELDEIRKIEQLAASDAPSREGAWWIMLQTAESVCNCASLRDPVNNAFLSEFWTDAAKDVASLLESVAERPLPYDDLMQMVSYCADQLQSIVANPRHNIVKADKMVMPQRVKNVGSKTMNWLGRQPGKTIKEKLAGKNKMLTQVNEYSYDIRENQVAMMLYREIMRRVSDRVNYGINTGGYDDGNSAQITQLLRIKKLLRNSPLADVHPKNHNQANNVLLSDKILPGKRK